jgi:hypothetical protein
MGFNTRYRGRYVSINPDNPSALGMCDESGFVFNHKDLVKQMQWRGNNLVWTGLLVGRPYLDKPCEQDRPPIVKDDPRAIANPRLPADYREPDANRVLPNKQLEQKLAIAKWSQ